MIINHNCCIKLVPLVILLVFISVRCWVDCRAIIQPEGLCQWKFPMNVRNRTRHFLACSAVPHPVPPFCSIVKTEQESVNTVEVIGIVNMYITRDKIRGVIYCVNCVVILCNFGVNFGVCIQGVPRLRSLLRESVPYVKIYWHNPKRLCPKLNGYGDNGKRKVWTSWGCTHYTCQLAVVYVRPCVGCHVTGFLLTVARSQELLVCSRC